jgi:hypothetical protein
MIRLTFGALWLAVCAALLICFWVVTVQIYECQADGSLWSHWLAYHMIDMRWRAVALAVPAALPGILSINAAIRRDRKR